MSDQRGKTISLRISGDDYEAVRRLYRGYGARNVSDFARLAIQRVVNELSAFDSTIFTRLHKLEERLSATEANVALLLRTRRGETSEGES